MVDLASALLSAENFPWFSVLIIGVLLAIAGIFGVLAYFVDSRAKYKMINMLLQNVEKGKKWSIKVGNVEITSEES